MSKVKEYFADEKEVFYDGLLKYVKNHGTRVFNERTKKMTIEVPVFNIAIDNPAKFAFKKLPVKYQRYFDEIRSQFEQRYELLKKENSTRRALINEMNTLNTDDITFPCIISHHFFIRNNILNMLSHYRSSDLKNKFIDDVSYSAKLLYDMGEKLNLKIGSLYIITTSLHYYVDEK